MKRIFLLIALVGMMAAGAAAQSTALVTLSHEGNLTFFEGYDSLEQALEAAQSGDVLYLSRGIYGVNSPEIIINKKVRLVGDGYDTFINSNVQFVSDGEAWSYTDAEPTLEGLWITQVNNAAIDSGFTDTMVIRSCKVDALGLRAESESYVLDRCYIGNINKCPIPDFAPGLYAKNCKIGTCNSHSFGENIVFENCNIGTLADFSGKAFNCYIINFSLYPYGGTGYAYKCWFNTDCSEVLSDSRTNECNICNLSQVENLNIQYTNAIGSDGTPVGILGGQFPYSEIPSVPTVDVVNSNVQYNTMTNQLNVNITVKE